MLYVIGYFVVWPIFISQFHHWNKVRVGWALVCAWHNKQQLLLLKGWPNEQWKAVWQIKGKTWINVCRNVNKWRWLYSAQTRAHWMLRWFWKLARLWIICHSLHSHQILTQHLCNFAVMVRQHSSSSSSKPNGGISFRTMLDIPPVFQTHGRIYKKENWKLVDLT